MAAPDVPLGTRSLAWRPLQKSTRLAIFVALLATTSYLLFLLEPGNRGIWWLWGVTVLAEGFTALHALGTWWTILAHDERPEPVDVVMRRNDLRTAAMQPPSIDVFVTACGEPDHLVLRTAIAARDMHLPHNTWVLDDGGSDGLRALCATAGIGYLRRDGSAHAKAGNVNAALACTAGEFVVILDADHVPAQDLLLEVLPHFVDPTVAFVQPPQSYANPDGLVARGAAEAQRIFYELVCPGKNHFNAAFCVGTNVMFRRAALAEIGGLFTGSNSEDIWTSVEMHRRGWRSVYVPQVLAKGLAPDDLGSFLKQQLRWASGGFEVLFRGRLLRRHTGLTLDQRLQYLLTGMHYLLSAAMLVFMCLPATFLLFGFSPISSDGWTWALHYVPFYATTLLVTWLQSGGLRPAAIVMSIAAAPVHVRALVATMFGRKAKWSVTNGAGGTAASLWAVMPHIWLIVLNVSAIAVGVAVMTQPAPTWLSVGWSALHVLLLARVVAAALGRDRRTSLDPSVGADQRSYVDLVDRRVTPAAELS